MKGLFKNNFCAVWLNAKIFLIFLFVMGIAATVIPTQTLQMYFIIVGIVTVLSYILHGLRIEQITDIFGLFALGISISLLMGAIFIPLIYLAGEDKIIAFLIISLLFAVGIASVLFNIIDIVPSLGTIIMIACSLLLFILSYPLAICIFKKKEY